MSTADTLAERAIELAGTDTETDDAVRDLLECCADSRVAVVMAKRHIEERVEESGDAEDPTLARAIGILGETLEKGPWDEAA
jgi:hypothetical protein